MRHLSRLVQLTSLLIAVVVGLIPALPASASSADPVVLKARALASLNAGYQVLLTGKATEVLIPDRGEAGIQRNSADRLTATLYRRDFNAQYGAHFTAVEVDLTVTNVTTSGTQAFLTAYEDVTMHFISGRPADAERDVTRMLIPHTFVFTLDGRGWRLDFDDAGGMRDHGSAPDLNHEIPSAGILATSTSTGGRLAAIPQDGASMAVAEPDRAASTQSAYGTWWPNPAGDYAYNWAKLRNSAYRNYSPDDCTNFVSQALRAGGWTDKLGFSWDWNNWWYTSYDQTTSWTYVAGLRQFMSTSGRGQSLAYINNMLKGDVLQADFGQNGSWDHSLMVDAAYGTNLSQIFVSYHDTDTQHRMMSDFLAAVQSQYGNTTYNAWHIIFTSN